MVMARGVDTYGIVGENAQLSAPSARRAAGFAEILMGGADQLPVTALAAMGIAVLLGIALGMMEQDNKWKVLVPSATGLGLGMLLPVAALVTLLAGATFAMLWRLVARKGADVYLIPLASGLIAGEALVAVLVPVLLWLGLGSG